MELTLVNLASMLRDRLDDGGSAAYTNAALYYHIRTAYIETQLLTKCHKEEQWIELVAGTHTYDLTTLFEPVQMLAAIEDA